MKVFYRCPGCSVPAVADALEQRDQFLCPDCGRTFGIPAEFREQQRLTRCLLCEKTVFYIRKAFPQQLGLAVIVLAALASSYFYAVGAVQWAFAVLIGCVVVELILYALLNWATVCYNCRAEYRGVSQNPTHGVFDMHTAERFRR
jgi:hypothetical protein